MLEILFLGIVAYCSIFAGVLLGKFSQDEIIVGEKHFSFVYAVSVFLYLVSLIQFQTSWISIAIVILCGLVFYFQREYYQMLFATFPFALMNVSEPLLVSILFFILGLIITTRELKPFTKGKKLIVTKQTFIHLLSKTYYFFPAAIVFFL